MRTRALFFVLGLCALTFAAPLKRIQDDIQALSPVLVELGQEPAAATTTATEPAAADPHAPYQAIIDSVNKLEESWKKPTTTAAALPTVNPENVAQANFDASLTTLEAAKKEAAALVTSAKDHIAGIPAPAAVATPADEALKAAESAVAAVNAASGGSIVATETPQQQEKEVAAAKLQEELKKDEPTLGVTHGGQTTVSSPAVAPAAAAAIAIPPAAPAPAAVAAPAPGAEPAPAAAAVAPVAAAAGAAPAATDGLTGPLPTECTTDKDKEGQVILTGHASQSTIVLNKDRDVADLDPPPGPIVRRRSEGEKLASRAITDPNTPTDEKLLGAAEEQVAKASESLHNSRQNLKFICYDGTCPDLEKKD